MREVEWPTVAVAAAIAASLATVLAVHDRLPALLTVLLLGIVAAWYNSLQHEVIHGHPTRWPALNTAFAVVPLGIVVPFRRYRVLHLEHHRTPDLTDPVSDPESFYVSAATWEAAGPLRRCYLEATRTLLGRMVLGPPVIAARWVTSGLRNLRTPRGALGVAAHVAGTAAVLAVISLAGVSLWVYLVGVVWVGGALSLLRSFAEHRMTESGARSATVRSGPVWSLLFLNNNLHYTHHVRPALPWYRLPELDARIGGRSAAGVYAGYGEIVRRFLVRPFDTSVWPARQRNRSRSAARMTDDIEASSSRRHA